MTRKMPAAAETYTELADSDIEYVGQHHKLERAHKPESLPRLARQLRLPGAGRHSG